MTKQILARGNRDQCLYILEHGHSALVSALHSKGLEASFDLWHIRLGHVPVSVISHLNKLGYLLISSLLPNPTLCSSCQMGKSKCLSFDLNEKCATSVLDMMHCDLWGPAPISTSDGFRYYVAFLDHFSRFSWIYPLRAKSDLYDVLVRFHKFVCNRFSSTIKVFQSNGGTEFTSTRVRDFMGLHGIQHHFSCPYTPQQNGRSECKHRHINEIGLSMLFHSGAPAVY